MRSDKELLAASKAFIGDNALRSWFEVVLTLLLSAGVITLLFLPTLPLVMRIVGSIIGGLLYVRLFVIYHDYQHRAILQNSWLADVLMNIIGVYLLAPENIWKRSHEHHHNNNSKLTISGIGSYPTVSKARFKKLTKKEQQYYLINRHPLTILFGHFTLFFYWLNLRSFVQSPKKHIDSLIALIFHVVAGVIVWYFFGALVFVTAWFFPFFLAFALGSYLFYCQHNFPGAKFQEDMNWRYVRAAMQSTSYMKMNAIMQWFTANIGYHQVHHLNSRIPFYRLKEALDHFPELQDAPITTWNPLEIIRCLQLKLWDPDKGRLITLQEFQAETTESDYRLHSTTQSHG
jgi:acyl-lipid omega-6 desaturase (Delta-12 desaturase)